MRFRLDLQTIVPIVLLVGLATLAHAQSVDTIVQRTGSPVRGEVVNASKESLSIKKVDGDTQQIPANQIRYVLFSGEPKSLKPFRDAAIEGNLPKAERYLARLDTNGVSRSIVRAEMMFYRALVAKMKAERSGKGLKAAASQMLQFVKSHRDSYHFYAAAEALGDLAVAMNRPAEASRYYKQLENAPWPDMKFRGTVLMAEALRSAGGDNLPEALKRYEQIVNASVDGPLAIRQQQLARVGQVAIQAELGDWEAGLATIDKLIANATAEDYELLAKAYNAKGLCEFKAQRPKDALISFLHVDTLFRQQADARAEALYFIHQLWLQLGHDDRATSAKTVLKTEFEGSSWSRKL